jgi:hydroxymethylpyrimidine pyrophosphatase-like HAD family hydrolase
VEQTLGLSANGPHDQVDIARKGNSKGKRLTQYVESRAGRCRRDAFGDNYNDISMLEAAGTGVAMGNADDAVKRAPTW